MKVHPKIRRGLSVIRRYRYKWVFFIAIAWTLIDLMLWAVRASVPQPAAFEDPSQPRSAAYVALRIGVVFGMSVFMGYMLVFRFRLMFRQYPLLINLIFKTIILMAFSFFMNFFNLFGYFYFIQGRGFWQSLAFYIKLPAEKFWLVHGLPLWLLIFIITQLVIEMSEKYSPGVFRDILFGKYIKPQMETRIVMFLDLKDSTPIAEQLGHKAYFSFIRDFIQHISMALLEHDGRIYQYVGDEIVVSWLFSQENAEKCIRALIDARTALQRYSSDFRRIYGITPEFRAGVHAGEVTVGEIGIIKKDLAMSGDTMNTAARIRSACSELNQKYIVSKDFIELSALKEWQSDFLGSVELKGKSNTLDLFALKI